MKKTFKYLKCHPKYKNIKSCMNGSILLEMRDKWNTIHPEKKIKTKKNKLIESKLIHYLSNCNNQKCLIENTLKKKLNIFAPNSPSSWNKNKSEWLDSLDIIRVMKQYEETYANFKFLGPSPIDFDSIIYSKCVWPDICNLSIKEQLQLKKNKIGIILNLDKHDKDGSHWVCIFIDLENKYLHL